MADFDLGVERQRALEEAHRTDVAVAILGALTGTPIWYSGAVGNRQLLEQHLDSHTRPSRDTQWASEQSRVHLVFFASGPSEVTWSSARLGPHFVRQQEKAAAVQSLADAL